MKWKTDINIEIESFLKACLIFPKISYEFSKNGYKNMFEKRFEVRKFFVGTD